MQLPPARQDTGAVKTLLKVVEQAGFAEKEAVTFTAAPFAVRLVKVTVCGEAVMAKDCPFTNKVPVAGGVL